MREPIEDRPGDSTNPEVVWPDPSPLATWWNAVMGLRPRNPRVPSIDDGRA